MSTGKQALSALFQTVSPRTAGFNNVDLNQLSGGSKLLTILLMLVGGSPSSTAGGIKTTTLAILLLALRAAFTSDHQVHCFGRRIPAQVITRTLVVSVLYGTLFLVASMALIQLEPVTMEEALFECASAIGTVGLTLGITPELGAVSKGILILLMYLGRVGGLTLVYAVSGTGKPCRKNPSASDKKGEAYGKDGFAHWVGTVWLSYGREDEGIEEPGSGH